MTTTTFTPRPSYTTDVAAGKAIGRALGLEGRGGGWVYRVGGRRAVCQGWANLARRYGVTYNPTSKRYDVPARFLKTEVSA